MYAIGNVAPDRHGRRTASPGFPKPVGCEKDTLPLGLTAGREIVVTALPCLARRVPAGWKGTEGQMDGYLRARIRDCHGQGPVLLRVAGP